MPLGTVMPKPRIEPLMTIAVFLHLALRSEPLRTHMADVEPQLHVG